MTIQYNKVFDDLLKDYNLPSNLSFSIDIPSNIQNLLNDEILVTDLGVSLKSSDRLYKATKGSENQIIIEDNENHFHVDWYVDPPDNKRTFMLGAKTLISLADKFQMSKITGIRFWFSFQTPEMGREWATENNLDQADNEHYISDRLSFFTRREGHEIVTLNNNESGYWAILTIDV
jgi:hypothetical protein